MSGFRLKMHLVAVASLAILAGCEEGKKGNFFGTDQAAPGAAVNAKGPTVERDVEMPDVFYRDEEGLWDGRPSLGGIWVAHPDVTSPERVKIVNAATGREIVGALFRRERNNPGPSFQVSSDAAAELGMLAGSPTSLTVTAIRVQEVVIEPEVPVVADVGDITETPLDGEDGAADPIASLAASAIEKATGATETSVTPDARPVQAASAAEVKSSLEKPFIQVGIFSVKENAEKTKARLEGGGIVPLIKEFTSNGKNYWRVVVGPLASATDRQAMLKTIQGLGFADAYPVTH